MSKLTEDLERRARELKERGPANPKPGGRIDVTAGSNAPQPGWEQRCAAAVAKYKSEHPDGDNATAVGSDRIANCEE